MLVARKPLLLRNKPSDSLVALSKAGGFTRQPLGPSKKKLATGKRLMVNWGQSNPQVPAAGRVLNPGKAVELASNKLSAFRALKEGGVRVPAFSTNPDDIPRDKGIMVARTLLRASEGRGIVVVRPSDNVPSAPLYVQYIRKDSEYRVHVLGGEAKVVQQKRRRSGVDMTADQLLIRNYDNGWVFAIENVQFPSAAIEADVKQQAVNACAALGLDFGAVDVIVSKKGVVYVLEVNTAPGIESPSVLAAYVDYFKSEQRKE